MGIIRSASDTAALQDERATPGADRAPRVLHVLKSLPLGGIETWLMHIFRADRNAIVRHELLLTEEEPGVYEPEARRLGIRIHKLPKHGGWLRWFRDLHRFLRRHGPFDAVHSHASRVGGAIVATAALAGVPSRIAHQHDARSAGPDFTSVKDRLVRRATMILTRAAATRRIGITQTAIEDIAGRNWRRQADCSILLYGFDYSAFAGAADRARVLRDSLQLAETDRIVGHVGRFDQVKNHPFLLRSFARAARTDPSLRLVMVGRGRLEGAARDLVEQLGIEERVRFAGSTQDVAAHMTLFDLFVFPSFSEGLGIVCVEAQAAGTRVLASHTVPAEVSVVPGAVEFLSLAAGEAAWADRIIHLAGLPKPDGDAWRTTVEQSVFGLDRCLEDLHAIYRQELGLDR